MAIVAPDSSGEFELAATDSAAQFELDETADVAAPKQSMCRSLPQRPKKRLQRRKRAPKKNSRESLSR